MGSWTDLDANYPPDGLTPGAALVVALGRLTGATSVYGPAGALAAFLPPGLAYDADLLRRAERFLADAPTDAFVAEAVARLGRRQRLCLLLNLFDRLYAAGFARPDQHPLVAQLLDAFAITPEQLAPLTEPLAIKNDLSIFPQ